MRTPRNPCQECGKKATVEVMVLSPPKGRRRYGMAHTLKYCAIHVPKETQNVYPTYSRAKGV